MFSKMIALYVRDTLFTAKLRKIKQLTPFWSNKKPDSHIIVGNCLAKLDKQNEILSNNQQVPSAVVSLT